MDLVYRATTVCISAAEQMPSTALPPTFIASMVALDAKRWEQMAMSLPETPVLQGTMVAALFNQSQAFPVRGDLPA